MFGQTRRLQTEISGASVAVLDGSQLLLDMAFEARRRAEAVICNGWWDYWRRLLLAAPSCFPQLLV